MPPGQAPVTMRRRQQNVKGSRSKGGDMAGLGVPELLIVLLVLTVLFGASRLPKLARSVGEASKEFREGLSSAPSGRATSGDDEQS